MAEEGEQLLIADSNDQRLHQRNSHADQNNPPDSNSLVKNALLVPLLQDESEGGVLEAINKDGSPFDEDDLFFMSPSGRGIHI